MPILDETEWLVQSDNYADTTDWEDEANAHDAQFGSTSGADVNDPQFQDVVSAVANGQYARFDGVDGNSLNLPHYSALDVTTDLDLRIRIAMDTLEIDGASSNLLFRTDNTYRLDFSVISDDLRLFWHDGTALRQIISTVAPSTILNDGQVYVFRATLDVDNGDDDAEITFWWSLDTAPGSETWNQLGAVVLFGSTTSIRTTAAPMQLGLVGTAPLAPCNYYSAQVLAGIDGTLVMDVRLEDATRPFATFTERSNSEVVTINRSALPSRQLTIIDRPQMLLSTDDYFEIPDDVGLDLAAGDPGTLMVMFSTNTVTGDDVLVAKKDDLTTSAGWAMVRSGATGQGIIADGTLDDDDTVATVAVRELHTLAFVRNTTDDDLEVFLDGVPSGSATVDSTTATLANSLVARIGATSGTTALNFHEGSIFSVAWWLDELTNAEIAEADTALRAVPAPLVIPRQQLTTVRL